MTRPGRVPIYAGPRVHRAGRECVCTPIPSLRVADNATSFSSSSETVIRWPPQREDHPLDPSIGNCDEELYCGRDHTCHERLAAGASCDTSNQCSTGPCINGTCQFIHEEDQILAGRAAGSSFAHYESPATNIVHVIAAIFGILGALLVGVGIFIMFRRRRARQAPADAEQRPPGDTSRFHKFANDFCQENQPNNSQSHHNEQQQASPMMQQIHLQFKLLQQQQQASKPSTTAAASPTSSTPSTPPPPPPYHP
ncbi:hypothetical protein DFQ28_006998 [Apophysomyces sp. BC1034]|nr:hypothetical protein DFQ30_009623 [Apophysomyces sp. BC1015]KAG0192966.1 hypothetical protein DFQ28_006998 [Apophysomyces sp. BC1034]